MIFMQSTCISVARDSFCSLFYFENIFEWKQGLAEWGEVGSVFTGFQFYFFDGNRYSIMHQRCLRVGKDRNCFQGLNFMLVPLLLSS